MGLVAGPTWAVDMLLLSVRSDQAGFPTSVFTLQHLDTGCLRLCHYVCCVLTSRCVTPWLVVLLHRPMYVVFPHKSNREVGEHIRAQIEPLLLQHKVDLTIAGHVHSYYRSCAVRDEQCVDGYTHAAAAAAAAGAGTGAGPSSEGNAAGSSHSAAAGAAAGLQQQEQHGVVHLIIGSAGRKLSDVERDQAEWCVETVKEWGYGRFTVRGSRSLLVEYVSSEAGEVLDSVELKQPAGDALCSPAAAAMAS